MAGTGNDWRRRVSGWFSAPAHDFWHGFERCLDGGVRALIFTLIGLGLGWWLYVPLHELLHAAACVLTGGTVSELEIAPLYGGDLLARWVPFVVAGGDYAGRLSGFDTHGSDAIYLATDFGPFVLTLFPGIWAFLRAGRRRRPLAFGFWLPFALAPFLSLPGDAYEIGSILVSRLAMFPLALRGDDLFKKAGEVAELPGAAWLGFVLAAAIGALWAFATYGVGRWLALRLERPASE